MSLSISVYVGFSPTSYNPHCFVNTCRFNLIHKRLVTLDVRLRIHGPIKTTPEFDAGGLRVKVGLP